MSTTVSYAGINLQLVRTNRYSCTPVYSQDGVDYLYTIHRFDLTCIVNAGATSYATLAGIPVALAGQAPSTTIQAIRHALLQPRQRLVVNRGGATTPLISSPQTGADGDGDAVAYPTDCNNGPKPLGAYVTALDNDRTWLVNWSVETALVECPNAANPNPLLSNRFGQTSIVDGEFMTTLITQGRAEFRSDVLEATGQTADQFRSRCLPQVPTGFRRERITVAVDSKRNSLNYEVVDRETYFDLGDTDPRKGGSGALRVEGTFRVAGVRAPDGGVLGGMTAQTVDLRIQGQRNSSQQKLLALAVLIAKNKLPIGVAGTGAYITQAGVSQSLTDPSMALSITMMVSPRNLGKAGVSILDADGLLVDSVFAPQGGISPAPPNDGGTRGNATDLLVSARFRAACADLQKELATGPPAGGTTDAAAGTAGPEVVVVPSSSNLPTTANRYSSDQVGAFPYDEYHYNVLHETNAGLMAAPLAGPTSTGGYVPGGGSSGNSFGPDQSPDVVILSLSRPMTFKIVEGTASRIGQPPTLPRPQSTDSNLALLNQRINSAAPELLPDGQTPVYRVSFWYKYAIKRSPRPGDDLFVGLLPIFAPGYAVATLAASQFASGIIEPFVATTPTPVGPNS